MRGNFITIDSEQGEYDWVFKTYGVTKIQIAKLYELSPMVLTVYVDDEHLQISNFSPINLEGVKEFEDMKNMPNIDKKEESRTHSYGYFIFRPFNSFLEIPIEILEKNNSV